MQKSIVLIFVTLLLNFGLKANEPISLLYDDVLLIEAKKAVDNGVSEAVLILEKLEAQAKGRYLEMEPLNVTMKKNLPPSGDARDYMTLSPYWWANPDTPDGLPYIRRDGELNPEVYDYPERVNSGEVGQAAQTLGLLYYVTEDEQYALKCAELLREWFLDPTVGMNPNMVFAQIRPGHSKIRGTGIIDSRRFILALEGAKLIEGSKAWSDADNKKLRDWVRTFLYWLENSTFGQMEHKSENNHGLWYETIRLTLIAYLGDFDYAVNVIKDSVMPKMESQIAEDGTLPKELERTLGLHYSTFAVEAIMVMSNIAEKAGFDLWNATLNNGRNFKQTIDYLYPYYIQQKEWPYQQISPFNYDRAAIVLDNATRKFKVSDYGEAAKKIGLKSRRADVDLLIYYYLNRQ